MTNGAVQTAVSGEKTAAAALVEAAARWREITAALGDESQRHANARSLGAVALPAVN